MKKVDEPRPNPALRVLNRLSGTWIVSGEAHGEVTFSWMEGGFFMVQEINLIGTKGIEFIGYDAESETLRSHYFDCKGRILEFTYQVSETEHIVSIQMQAVKGEFKGKFSNDGKTISGNWRLTKDGVEMNLQTILTHVTQQDNVGSA